MITLRLPNELEKEITATAESIGMSKSELVRNSVLEYLGKIKHANPWDLGHDLFAKHSSGRRDLSEKASSLFREKLLSKRK
ncbi:MAG: CopG family transcriptional regulator [Candidatus Raymondbacteria bacterium RifOxyA12_full_50_37]|uniref:CopG family transcriptional regulator n=1 Tax=Candidatus Raymondbacteria bacterium RIFOXYD12_FULL_49_13 TaxID=1817890 RepID=A0A1F7FJ09_UNCRA|nr:MAG: CopG family transcriptional regulator [Candidatus Raymondbacteria bacterium RifOxyA12_full_50_37]OGJ92010.1 MAG: CopG family transcriptional regulator [Candidatus Raymondbacteria bacterium RIFOXYA2_FULL_49_16]OGJ99753.1 MAG: CopG family transcriptional regulator [Candidatus Raymondbacteria bacterium RifOxyB12_full_50_8]OGK06551.1 MAG: CopG family transcriptional regulator [Candidatus Raymondbacteria bacterium RIFOXYD12_FULL_49_13]OGK06560.1 MAG: CopG family transcriptional regulator [Ca